MTRSTPNIDGFVADVRDAFRQAAEAGPIRERSLRLADHALRLRIAGPALADAYTPALAHLADPACDPAGPADLVVACWERAGTGVAPPPPPWSFDDFLPRGRIRGLVQDRIRIAYDALARTLTVYDRDAGEAFVHVADAAAIPTWVTRAPLRTVFTWWAGHHHLAFLHASAVADPDGAVALAGSSGSGKSTTALTCFAAGMQLLGDDACIAGTGTDPTLFPVYGFAKLERDALERLPELGSHVVDHDADQLVVAPPDRPGHGAPLRALMLPRVAGTVNTDVAPVSQRDALRALVAGSLHEGDGAGGTALQTLARLVQRVPCYRLDLGTDRAGVVTAVRNVLDAT